MCRPVLRYIIVGPPPANIGLFLGQPIESDLRSPVSPLVGYVNSGVETILRPKITIIPSAVEGYCSPRVWRIFWSLRLPHKVVNCWWRLLKNCISSQAALHARWEARWPSPACRLCHHEDEDVFHFFVGCHHKWSFWQEALLFLSLDQFRPTQNDVWAAITGFHSLDAVPLS